MRHRAQAGGDAGRFSASGGGYQMNFLITINNWDGDGEYRFLSVFCVGTEDEAEEKAKALAAELDKELPYGWGVKSVRVLG
jgi:hypothetical protein